MSRSARFVGFAVLLAVLLAPLVLAQEYRVDPGGGPEGLAEAVQNAFEAWSSEGAEVAAEVTPDAPNLFRYGDATRLGPDVVSLTLTRGGSQGLTVLVNPEAQSLLAPAFLHETGLVLGLSAGQDGVMNPAFSPESPSQPTEANIAALAALTTFAPADINQDGVVDFYDLAALATDFGRTGVNLPSDIDGDGAVDDQDLDLLREAYVFGPPAETPPASEGDGDEAPAEDALPEVPELGAPAEPEAPAGGEDTEPEAPSEPEEPGSTTEPDGNAPPEQPNGETP